jgi:cytochrome d ubiquinol oxidase subunit I
MVGIGVVMAALGVLYFVYRRGDRFPRWYLGVLVAFIPLGVVAIEAGWIVTEVGRQPWIIYNVMRTAEAVTPVPGMLYRFFLILGIYLTLAVLTVGLLRRQVLAMQRKFGG